MRNVYEHSIILSTHIIFICCSSFPFRPVVLSAIPAVQSFIKAPRNQTKFEEIRISSENRQKPHKKPHAHLQEPSYQQHPCSNEKLRRVILSMPTSAFGIRPDGPGQSLGSSGARNTRRIVVDEQDRTPKIKLDLARSSCPLLFFFSMVHAFSSVANRTARLCCQSGKAAIVGQERGTDGTADSH